MSPDGEAIVTGAGDETLRFWNVFSKNKVNQGKFSVVKQQIIRLGFFACRLVAEMNRRDYYIPPGKTNGFIEYEYLVYLQESNSVLNMFTQIRWKNFQQCNR